MPRPPTAITGIKHDKALLLLDARLKDIEIAAALQVSKSAVRKWRLRHGLSAANAHFRIVDAIAVEMHRNNASDYEIARHFGTDQGTATKWRHRHGLPANRPAPVPVPKAKKAKAKKLLKAGATLRQVMRETEIGMNTAKAVRNTLGHAPELRKSGQGLRIHRAEIIRHDPNRIYDRIRKAVGWGVSPDIAADAVNDMYMALMEGKLAIDQIEAQARTYTNRVIRAFASNYDSVSLDAEIGEGGFSIGDMVPDPGALAAFDNIEWENR